MDFSLIINNKERVFKKPIVMGILNVTPDSFYDGGKFISDRDILLHTEKMIIDGASIIDIGAISTRPGAIEVPKDQELNRLLAVTKSIVHNFPDAIISVDTYRSQIARIMIENGVHIINDISGGSFDDKMFEVIAKYNVPYILMQIQGTPKSMQVNPHYDSVLNEIKHFFEQQLAILTKLGVTKNIILDPGFGFGKTLNHNYELLNHLEAFKKLGYPVLVGVSRKSMINKVLNTKPQQALNGTTVLNTIALLNGANMLRVHDVKEAAEAIQLVKFYNHANNE